MSIIIFLLLVLISILHSILHHYYVFRIFCILVLVLTIYFNVVHCNLIVVQTSISVCCFYVQILLSKCPKFYALSPIVYLCSYECFQNYFHSVTTWTITPLYIPSIICFRCFSPRFLKTAQTSMNVMYS